MLVKREIVLGALLHDIGKFVMRGQNSNINHSLSGFEYLKSKGISNENILGCIKHHHLKNMGNVDEKSISNIIYLSDNISSSIDRRDDIGEEISKNTKWKRDVVLENIFNSMFIEKDTDNSYLSLDVLQDENSIFDSITNDKNKINDISKYNKVFNQFDSAFSRIDFNKDSIGSILNVMEITTNFVPSSTDNTQKADISLYNHSKITAMIASCIYEYFKSEGITNYKENCMNNNIYEKEIFTLTSFDLSGIQNFIYNSAEKNALKLLRGRSFYLEIITETIIDEILDYIDLTRVNLLYSGGGHFYLLLPNTANSKEKIKEATEKINSFLMDEFNGVLSISSGYSVCTANDLRNSKEKNKKINLIGEVFKKNSSSISRHKLSKYSKKQLEHLFLSANNTIDRRECMICRTTENLQENGEKKDQYICDICNSSISLGGEIPNLDEKLLVVSSDAKNSLFKLPYLNDDRKYLKILSKDETSKLIENNELDRAYSINKYLSGNKFAQNLWVGNYSYNNNFEELANLATGIKRIGVLRMDIDDLGNAISKGFENKGEYPYQYVSFSRSSMLSYNLSLFFKNEINKIAKSRRKFSLNKDNNNDEARKISIVYSGGDDLFVVGAWNEVLEFSIDVNNYFKELTNGKLTLSGGFSIFSHNFPVYQMARVTGLLEEKAKDSPGKNSISLFGDLDDNQDNTYSWSIFEENICNNKLKFLLDNLQDEEGKDDSKLNIGMSMVYKLLNLLRCEDKENINLARMAYTLARLEPSENSKKEAFNNFKEKMYEYSKNIEDKKYLIMAIYLYVYLNRKD